jgi:hypothetical protein
MMLGSGSGANARNQNDLKALNGADEVASRGVARDSLDVV